MRLSQVWRKQNIGWHFKKFWAAKSVKKIIDTGIDAKLIDKNISVIKPEDVLYEKPEFRKIEIVGYKTRPVALDETHPKWNDRPLLTYKDHNALLEGLNQALVLTNTVEVLNGLPPRIENDPIHTQGYDARVKEIILTSHVFNAEQEKLPKINDPARPAWNFPRTYGITQNTINTNLLTNLLQLIENTTDRNLVKERFLFDKLYFSYYFERGNDQIQFAVTGDKLITSTRPLSAVFKGNTASIKLPNLSPIEPTITLNQENIYDIQTVYPIDLNLSKPHPHTLVVYHNEEEVKNLFEEPVTESQVLGRSLLKSFTVAASYAQSKFGDQIKELPSPVTVQCVQTNGRLFDFGVFQLNTLDLEDDKVKNVWYQCKRIALFENCFYRKGKPILDGYNSIVSKYLYSFYNNV